MNESPPYCLLRRAARRFASAPAMITPTCWLSFGELDARVDARARVLRASPFVAAGDWVVLPATLTPAALIDLLALMRAGLPVLLINPDLPEPLVLALMQQHRLRHRLQPDGTFAPETAHGDPDSTQGPACGSSSEGRESVAAARQAPADPLAPDRPCTGILTSGSTGVPKVAVHRYCNHVLSAKGACLDLGLQANDRYLLSLPYFHVAGLGIVFRCLWSGAALVLGGRAEDPDFLQALDISQISMVDTQLLRLLGTAGALPRLHGLLLGGGPVRPALLDAARTRGLPIRLSYGLTEMSSLVISQELDGPAHLLMHREVRIGEQDEILVRGGTLFLGYLQAGRVMPATDAQGWFHTRDCGTWDGASLRVWGRLDHQFISGGENIQPEAIEAVLCGHPAIQRAVVVPQADATFGLRPVAFLDTVRPLSEAELRCWLHERLSPWQMPTHFQSLPRDGSLKIRRADLMQQAGQAR